MGAQLRIYRRRIRSVNATKKITKAMELIAASRIVKAQQRVRAAQPYARQITRVISALASQSTIDHPLVTEHENPSRAAVLVITSDRGLAGGYNANALKAAEGLYSLLRSEGKEPVVSVHIFSRPIESCVAFDLEKRTCYRRQLSFYSRYGHVVVDEGALAANSIPDAT